MSANLFNSRYFGRAAAWHNMGVVMDRPMTASEAVAYARLDYKVLKTQSFFRVEDPDDLENPSEYALDGTMAIYREPTDDDPFIRPFGTSSKNFTIVQNTDLAKILDPMTESWPVETAGALGAGETVWFLLDMGEGTIAGEQFRRFAWTRNSHIPGQGLMFKPVRTRVVCANTDLVAMNEKGVTISLRHTADVQSRFEEVIKAMDQLRSQNAIDEQALEALAEYAISQEEITQVLEKAYPTPKVPVFRTLNGKPSAGQERMLHAYELLKTRMVKYQVAAQEEYETLAISFPRLAKTGYAVYQGIISAEQYRRNTSANAVASFFGNGLEVQKIAKQELLSLVN